MTTEALRRRRREPTEAERQAKQERQAERLIRLAILRIATRTTLPRFRVAAIFGAIVAERE
jgi:hypothetical protein